MAHERRCLLCGTEYKYCSHCNDYDPTETWRYLFHDEKCLELSNVWYAYRGNEISKEEAKKRFEKYPENLDKILKYTSIAAKEIRAIFDIPEEEPKKDEEVAEKTEMTKKESDEKVSNAAKQSFKHNGFNKNYKK